MLKFILILFCFLFFCSAIPKPVENPGRGCILLTFNGYESKKPNNYQNCFSPSGLLQDDRLAIQTELGGYFKIWDVVITTDEDLFYRFPNMRRVRCVITSDTLRYEGQLVGGLADTTTIMEYDTTALLISVPNLAGPTTIARACAHEIGHSLGLNHYPEWAVEGVIISYPYNYGNSYEAPIMGTPYYAERAMWAKGTNNQFKYQNDTLIISKTFRRLSPNELQNLKSKDSLYLQNN